MAHCSRIPTLLAVVMLVAATTAPAAPQHPSESIQRRVLLMGTWLDVQVSAPDRVTASAIGSEVIAAFRTTEQRLSTWREDSELALLNHFEAGRWMSISSELEHDLERAIACWQQTRRAFSPGLGSLISAWDLRGSGRVPTEHEHRSALLSSSMDAFEVVDGRARRHDPDFAIEEGGFAKGVGLAEAAAVVATHRESCAVVDIGGQVLVSAGCPPRTIGLAHPTHRHLIVADLDIRGSSLATSGQSERGFDHEGRRYGHVLDPRTGMPAENAGTVTVISEDPVAADCLATALLVMSADEALTWLSQHPDVQAVLSRPRSDGAVLWVSDGLARKLRIVHPGVEVREIATDAIQGTVDLVFDPTP